MRVLRSSVIGLTPNQVLNSVYASRARELFGVPRTYIAVQRAGTGIAPDLVQKQEAQMLFEAPHDAEKLSLLGIWIHAGGRMGRIRDAKKLEQEGERVRQLRVEEQQLSR